MQKKYFLTLDCETCTYNFANQICADAEQKKKIAIAFPLIYDIGWLITDRMGNVYKKVSYLVNETFMDSATFQTAYYAEKRPIYLQKLRDHEISLLGWNAIIDELEQDLANVECALAYNAMFDFKKAIPTTEQYIKAYYSDYFFSWMEGKKRTCARLLEEKHSSQDDFDGENLYLREKKYPIADIWGMTCDHLINTNKYRNYCLKHNYISNSGDFFKTSAETTFRYLTANENFDEAHTALDDAIIEAQILAKMTERRAVTKGIDYFPFRKLGNVYDYVMKYPKLENLLAALEAYKNYLNAKTEFMNTPYVRSIQTKVEALENLIGA